MLRIESLIAGSEKLTALVGRWPTFHDAEVSNFDLWRGKVEPESDNWVMPTATVTLIAAENLGTAKNLGSAVQCIDIEVTIRFSDLDELEMVGFNHQNAILGLEIKTIERTDELPLAFLVEFKSAHGLQASFRCFEIEVLNALPCTQTETGKV